MPSLEQIVRPFVVDSTLPPVPVITTANDPPPELVRLSIGIGGSNLNSLSDAVAPNVPPDPAPAETIKPTKPKVELKTTSSSWSLSATWYHDEKVQERRDRTADGGSGGDTGGSGQGPAGPAGEPKEEEKKDPTSDPPEPASRPPYQPPIDTPPIDQPPVDHPVDSPPTDTGGSGPGAGPG